jgi:NifB/MoaA-like Fe-S oxidoreductase
VTVVTGEMFAPRMRTLLEQVPVDGLRVSLVPVVNDFFGRGIGVAGLLTGRDIQIQLDQERAAGRELGDEILVPAVAIRDGAGVFLDDLTPADLAGSLGTPVTAVEPDAPALLAALLGR